MNIIDFSSIPLSDRNLEYAGRAGEKRGIIYKNEYWFLKFPKNTIGMDKVAGLSYVTSPLSEYIGSKIYKILEYEVHDTILGVCFDGKREKVVCACRDFIKDDKNELLIPYTALRNDTNPLIMNRNDDVYCSPSNINEIVFQLDHNVVLSKIRDAKKRFFEVLIIDMLINNNDRNEDNWGVVKFKDTNIYKLAPIYDCGNSFYGKTSEERIKNLLEDEAKLKSSALNGITIYENSSGKRIPNLQILSLNNNDLDKAIIKVYELVKDKLNDIIKFINEIPNEYNGLLIMSNDRKEYYIKTIELRINEILKPKYLEKIKK
jgi:hypothetical protein